MNNARNTALRTACTALFALGTAMLAAHSTAAEETCIGLLETRCEKCHYVTRVCQKVETEMGGSSWFGGSGGAWKRTIKNMVRQGAKLSKDEEKQLVACLSEPGPELLEFCQLDK